MLFRSRPRLSFGLALPLAAGSRAEYVDIELAAEVPFEGLAARLSNSLPPGFEVMALAEKAPGTASLQEDVVACDWEFELGEVSAEDAAAAISTVLAAERLPLERERKGERRTDDVRPAIESLGVRSHDERVVLQARLATVGRGLRPTELVAVMFPTIGDSAEIVRSLLRTEQWIERDGARRELLPAPAAVVAPAELVGA